MGCCQSKRCRDCVRWEQSYVEHELKLNNTIENKNKTISHIQNDNRQLLITLQKKEEHIQKLERKAKELEKIGIELEKCQAESSAQKSKNELLEIKCQKLESRCYQLEKKDYEYSKTRKEISELTESNKQLNSKCSQLESSGFQSEKKNQVLIDFQDQYLKEKNLSTELQQKCYELEKKSYSFEQLTVENQQLKQHKKELEAKCEEFAFRCLKLEEIKITNCQLIEKCAYLEKQSFNMHDMQGRITVLEKKSSNLEFINSKLEAKCAELETNNSFTEINYKKLLQIAELNEKLHNISHTLKDPKPRDDYKYLDEDIQQIIFKFDDIDPGNCLQVRELRKQGVIFAKQTSERIERILLSEQSGNNHEMRNIKRNSEMEGTSAKKIKQDGDLIIEEVRNQVHSLQGQIENFLGNSEKENEYLYLDNMLLNCLLDLDKITTKDPNIKAAKRDTIKMVKETVERLEKKLVLNRNQFNSS